MYLLNQVINTLITKNIFLKPSATATYGFANIGTDQPGITDDLLQVNVYFKSLNVRTVKETPTYEQVNQNFEITYYI